MFGKNKKQDQNQLLSVLNHAIELLLHKSLEIKKECEDNKNSLLNLELGVAAIKDQNKLLNNILLNKISGLDQNLSRLIQTIGDQTAAISNVKKIEIAKSMEFHCKRAPECTLRMR